MASRGARRSSVVAGLALAALIGGLLAQPAAARTLDPEIVGGEPTQLGEYPFMAAILDDAIPGSDWSKQFCGGSLIAPEWVLTAAHCLDGRAPQDLAVAVGRTRLDEDEGVRVDVAAGHLHPGWHTPIYHAHDIALLRLASPVRGITPIRLASRGQDELEAAGTRLVVLGWGNTEASGEAIFPDELREVVVPAVADATCGSIYESSFDAGTMLCAGEKGTDSCQGDSGGPLFVERRIGPVQVGAVSFGVGCAKGTYPGVYGEINSPTIRSWIASVSGV